MISRTTLVSLPTLLNTTIKVRRIIQIRGIHTRVIRIRLKRHDRARMNVTSRTTQGGTQLFRGTITHRTGFLRMKRVNSILGVHANGNLGTQGVNTSGLTHTNQGGVQ